MHGSSERSLTTKQVPLAPRGPARADERALAPDLARGVMLLMIVLANTPWYLYGQTTGLTTVHPQEGSALDRLVQLLIITFIDSRVYPMFAFLFGYGMVQLFSRQVAAGTPVKVARRMLRARAGGVGVRARGFFGSAAVALFAIGVWLLTVAIAYASERAGVRGPAEVLLRRLVYPRSGTRVASTA